MYLGIDLGTTNVKAIVMDPEGKVLGTGASPVKVNYIGPDGVEQDIENIWNSLLAAIHAVGAQCDLKTVRAVGVSSQGAAIQLSDTDGTPVGPVISWMDKRGDALGQRLEFDLGTQWFMERVGHGRCCFGSKLRLIDEGLLVPGRAISYVGDMVVSRLCGRRAHDASSLSICGIYNPALRKADPDCLRLMHLNESTLPELVSPLEPAGALLSAIARDTGLKSGIPVSIAVHDQYAASLGAGAVMPGDTLFGGGTAWVLLVTVDALAPPVAPSAWVCNHLIPDRWGQLASLVIGGSVFELARKVTGTLDRSLSEIEAWMDTVPSGCDGLRVSLGPGKMDCSEFGFDGADIAGLHFNHSSAHLLRAVIEGLTRSLAHNAQLFADAGAPIARIHATGGAARSRVTAGTIATTLQVPVECIEGEISARGAAMLACALAEGYSLLDIANHMMAPRCAIVPRSHDDPNRRQFLDELDNRA